jgi:hypothetical protein
MGISILMLSRNYLPSIAGFALLVACSALSGQAAAQTTTNVELQATVPYECDLSEQGGGSVGACANNLDTQTDTTGTAITGVVDANNTAQFDCPTTGGGPSFCGSRTSVGNAVVPIDVWGKCRWIDDKGPDSIWVPFRTAREWTQFIQAATPNPAAGYLGLPGITLTHCGEPFAETHAYAAFSTNPSSSPCTAQLIASSLPCNPLPAVSLTAYAGANCSPQSSTDGSIPTPAVYGRGVVTPPNTYGSVVSMMPAIPATQYFTCYGGTTTLVGSFQFEANDSDNPDSVTHLTWAPIFNYSPNLVLTVTDTTNAQNTGASITVNAGTPVTLHWTTNPPAVSCNASIGWSGSQTAPSGTSPPITPAAATNYKLSCNTANGLTSTATASVNLLEPALCGSDNGATALTEPPVNLCTQGETASAPSVTANGWSWTCTATKGEATSTKTCGATLQGAACGPVNGTTVASMPTTGLCNVGTASTPTGSGPWAWTCTDDNGASIANCSANSSANNCTFTVTSSFTGTVPNNITGPVHYTLTGGGGGGGKSFSGGNNQGSNGTITAGSFTPNSGDTLTIYAGGGGGSADNAGGGIDR